jgi:hypothetical protein
MVVAISERFPPKVVGMRWRAGAGGSSTPARPDLGTDAAGGAEGRFRWATPRTALVVGVLTLLMFAASVPLAKAAKAGSAPGLMIPFGVLGFVLARRQPRNPIGWILLLLCPVFIVSNDAGLYSLVAYHVDGHDLPLSRLAVVLAPDWALLQVVLPLPILLFPDGRITSRRWRLTLWAYLAVGATWLVTLGVLGSVALTQHPVRINAAGASVGLDDSSQGVGAEIQNVLVVVYVALILSWVLRLLVSYRSSTGDLRQQLKWLMVGGTLCVVGILSGAVLSGIGSALFTLILAFPICIGIAILKYRLYDIDRLISRTLSYLIVTGLLIGVYVGLVALTTRALPLSSPVGVAASTLAVAALFSPVRRRAQRLVDRRFNRARYDADATIAAFTAALRNEIDLDRVQRDLVDVVSRSVQPAHVSVWIRSSA